MGILDKFREVECDHTWTDWHEHAELLHELHGNAFKVRGDIMRDGIKIYGVEYEKRHCEDCGKEENRNAKKHTYTLSADSVETEDLDGAP